MKKTLSLLLSCFLFAVAASAQAGKPAVMTVAVPGMDAAMAEKAVAAVTPVAGVIAAAPDLKKGQLQITIQRENAADTRKAVRGALKKAGVKFEMVRAETGKQDGKAKKDDKAPKAEKSKKAAK